MPAPAVDARTIHERMVAILDELPAIGKTQRNQQQNFNFRGHDDVLNALTPLLAKHGVLIIPNVLERSTDQRTTAKGTVMYEVNLHVQFTCYGKAGDSIVGSAWGEGTDMGDKSTMKAGTMAFKAFLNQSFAINTEEGAAHDADRTTPEPTVAKRPVFEAPNGALMDAAQRAEIGRLVVACARLKGITQKAVRDAVGATDDLDYAAASALIGKLTRFEQTLAAQVPA